MKGNTHFPWGTKGPTLADCRVLGSLEIGCDEDEEHGAPPSSTWSLCHQFLGRRNFKIDTNFSRASVFWPLFKSPGLRRQLLQYAEQNALDSQQFYFRLSKSSARKLRMLFKAGLSSLLSTANHYSHHYPGETL